MAGHIILYTEVSSLTGFGLAIFGQIAKLPEDISPHLIRFCVTASIYHSVGHGLVIEAGDVCIGRTRSRWLEQLRRDYDDTER